MKFEGKDITRLKQSQLKEVYGDIQMVFQNPVGSFDPRRTLGDGIGESLRNRGMKKADVEKRVAELLEQCGLEKEYAKRYPHEVSRRTVSAGCDRKSPGSGTKSSDL